MAMLCSSPASLRRAFNAEREFTGSFSVFTTGKHLPCFRCGTTGASAPDQFVDHCSEQPHNGDCDHPGDDRDPPDEPERVLDVLIVDADTLLQEVGSGEQKNDEVIYPSAERYHVGNEIDRRDGIENRQGKENVGTIVAPFFGSYRDCGGTLYGFRTAWRFYATQNQRRAATGTEIRNNRVDGMASRAFH